MRAERAHKAEMGEDAADRAPPARRSTPAPDEREPRRQDAARLTSFIGRERELAEVAALLHAHRLVTLTGAPGVGKTRLGLEVANTVSAEFPDGVWLVELASLADPALVPQSVMTALGVREQPGRDATATLGDYLRSRSLLLVLDNCEHLVAAVAALAEVLLRACPDLRVLVTSRETLAIEGEVTWRVPSLTVPNVERVQTAGDDAAAALVPSEAARLFVERARAAAPEFVVTGWNAPTIAAICARLDGIPLALELAAARVRALSVEQIAARLDDRFRLLTGGSRTALPRYRTLRGAVEWSYDLLTESERALLRRLAVFEGSWTLEAAEAVCADSAGDGDIRLTGHADVAGAAVNLSDHDPGPLRLERGDVLDLLVSLVDRSLVQVEAGDGGEVHYRLLETIRQYGRDRLRERGELAAMRDRHLDVFLALAEDVQPRLEGPNEPELLRRLDREYANLRAALAWSQERADSARSVPHASGGIDASPTLGRGLRLAGAMFRFWWRRGLFSEGQGWLVRALDATPVSRDPPALVARAWALYGAARLISYQGDYRAAIRYMEGARAAWQELGRDADVITALNYLGQLFAHIGDYASGVERCEQGLALARKLGHAPALQHALRASAVVAWRMGRFEDADSFAEESIELSRESGDTTGVPYAIRVRSRAAYCRGEWARAAELATRALGLSRAAGDKRGIAESFKDLGYAAVVEGAPERADEMFRTGIALYREIGDRWVIALCLHGMAGAQLLRGIRAPRADAAGRPRADQAIVHFRAATQLLAAADAIAEADGISFPLSLQPDRDRDLALLGGRLGEEAFAEARAAGRAMTPEQAVNYALAMTPSAPPEDRGEPDAPLRASDAGPLSRREREIAALVAGGHTNRQIADELGLSERTVDAHAHNIFGKLGFTARAQVAAWSVEHGLAGQQPR